MKKLICLLVLAFTLVGCANPPTDRAQRLKQEGRDISAYEEEVKTQMDKFALFRSFLKADQILDQLERGVEVKANPTNDVGSCVEAIDVGKSVVCYRDSCRGGISCLKVN